MIAYIQLYKKILYLIVWGNETYLDFSVLIVGSSLKRLFTYHEN